jgi:hypothetical protein
LPPGSTTSSPKPVPGAFYVFDCLSDLLVAWATDAMIGNFFQVTCPYLFELDTIAYFALIRSGHSFNTIAQIRHTTQLLLDIYTCNGQNYVHPMKVWERHSPTMFLPHLEQGSNFVPIANSYDATNLTNIYQGFADNARRQLDYWDRLFLEAEELVNTPSPQEVQQRMVDQLCRVMIGHDDRMLDLARRFFSLEDLLDIKSRTIGTGYIGGKAVGMLLARNILLRDFEFDWQHYFEPHDSFYIASDIYFSYIVHNGWWKLLMQQKTPDGYFAMAGELQEKLRHGVFPPEVRAKFQEMLEHFGQYPIIVRSSSLLEDSFGNAFAGKYDSFFCVNQGTPEERYEQFENAVRQIFASTMSEDALPTAASAASISTRSRWPCWFSASPEPITITTIFRNWPVSARPTIPSSGIGTWIPRPACCAWCSASAPGRWIASRATIRASSLWTIR